MRLFSVVTISLLTAAIALECNICGPGNAIGKPEGILAIPVAGLDRVMSCQRWQESQEVTELFCQERMLQHAADPCECRLPSGSRVLQSQEQTIPDIISSRPELSIFLDALLESGMLEGLGDPNAKFTVFAPSNEAIEASPDFIVSAMTSDPQGWIGHLHATLNNHIVPNQGLTETLVFDKTRTTIQSLQDLLEVAPGNRRVGGASIVTADLVASNGYVHIVSNIIKPAFFSNSFARLELQPEYGPDWINRTSLVDIVDFVGGRDVLKGSFEAGATFAGCRQRALNRLGLDYLKQTINGAKNVKYGELMNETLKKETLRNFVKYQLIPTNYYLDQVPDGFTALVTPVADCGAMWITKKNKNLCFNDACVVATPKFRTYLSKNG